MVSRKVCAITGASGFLGSHIAEQLMARDMHVRALVRKTSDTSLLESLGIEQIVGDLNDPESLKPFCTGADVVYHCAAHLSDWGPWSDFVRGTIETTQNVAESCATHSVSRLVHVSSVAAYGHPQRRMERITEATPLGNNLWLWDYYAKSKMEAERWVKRLGRRAVIIRPTWTYGPRDRSVMPRLEQALRSGRLRRIGTGETQLNLVHVADVAAGAILAGESPAAAGEVFNLCSDGEITQRELFNALADGLRLPRVRRQIPPPLAYAFGFASEVMGKILGRVDRPTVTRHSISLISRPASFCSEKARHQLGWRPEVDIYDGLAGTIQWLKGRRDQALTSESGAR
jgi:nucleoside-diphosphate-sugar epimerase